MATTWDLTVTFTASVGSAEVGELTKALTDVVCDEIMGLQYTEIDNNTVDSALALGPLTTAYSLALISDQIVSVKVNGSATALTLRPNEPIVLPNVTALTVSNSSGATAKIQYIAAGT